MLPVRLRLVSAREDQSWAFPDVVSDDRAALQRGLREAADWLAQQVRDAGRGGLAALVLDADGSSCGWLGTLNAEPDAVGAAIAQAAQPVSAEDDSAAAGEAPPHLALHPDVRIPGAVSYQPLLGEEAPAQSGGGTALLARPQAPAERSVRRRVAVTVVPDASVRLLLDELDVRGVAVERVLSIWQALAEAFAERPGRHEERILDGAEATSAQVVVDGQSGRLLWAWSRAGRPLAAGSARLARAVPGEDRPAGFELTGQDLARLATEWLAWSTQLGASPLRVRALAPEGVWAAEESMGSRLATVWPGATVDIAFDDDPVGLALSRLADGGGIGSAGRAAIVQLQNRPGRPHRWMYRWAAGAIVVAAAGMGVAAWRVHQSAESAQRMAVEAREEWRSSAAGLMTNLTPIDPMAMKELEDELERRRRAVAPIAIVPEKPVMPELETLSFVLSNSDYELREIDLSEFGVTIDVTVPDTAAYEELINALSRIAGSSVASWDPRPQSQGDKIRVTITGNWASRARPAAEGA